jgi:hypothetical protein
MEKRTAYRLLIGKTRRKETTRRPRHRWVDNIKMNLVQIVWRDADWSGLAQDRDKWRIHMKAVMKLRVP